MTSINDIQSEDEKKAFAKTLKIALATSIIRSKPSGVSAKEYAAQLALKLKSSEASWKTKYHEIQADLERSQHEMVLLRLKNSQHQTVDTSSSVTSSSANNNGDDAHVANKQSEKHHSMIGNDLFSSVLSFKNWYERLSDDTFSLNILRSSFISKLQALDDSLSSASFDKHNYKLVRENTKVLGEMLKKEQFSSDVEIKKVCGNIIRTMVTKLMNNTSLKGSKVKGDIVTDLITFGTSCQSLRDILLEILVRVLVAFTSLLKDLPSFTRLNVTKYENVSYICKAMEEMITSTCTQWPCSKLERYSTWLDDGLFEISNRFVMYAHTLWMLSSLMVDSKYTNT